MPAYWIAHARIDDPEAYGKYADRVLSALAPHGGSVVVRSNEHKVLEGSDDFSRHLVVEFPSMEAGEAFFNSDDYQSAIAFRNSSGAGEVKVTLVS